MDSGLPAHDWTKAVKYHPYGRQPWKALFVFYTVTTLFVRVPFYALISIPKSWRPRPTWTFGKAFLIRCLRYWSYLPTQVGQGVFVKLVGDHRELVSDKKDGEGVKGVWVDPAPSLITGSLELWANIASTVPIRLPGYWMHREQTTIEVAAPPMPGEKVVYFLHGGGYVEFSAHPDAGTSMIPKGLLRHCDSVQRSFAIEYRLSVGPPNPPSHSFPAALVDALAGYHYLINSVGFSPNDIIIVGDSAGGNLAHALTRYLVEYQNTPNINLPAPPIGLILCSPWVDLSTSHCYPGSSTFTNVNSDFVEIDKPFYSRTAFLGIHGTGAASTNRYLSPASLDVVGISFLQFPKTFIINGGAEVLRDQICLLRDRMVRDMGSDCVYYEAEDAPHDYLALGWFEPECSETLQAIGKWLATF